MSLASYATELITGVKSFMMPVPNNERGSLTMKN